MSPMTRPIALPAEVAGRSADGLSIEVDPDPDRALSDGARSLDFDRFERPLGQLRSPARPLGRVARLSPTQHLVLNDDTFPGKHPLVQNDDPATNLDLGVLRIDLGVLNRANNPSQILGAIP